MVYNAANKNLTPLYVGEKNSILRGLEKKFFPKRNHSYLWLPQKLILVTPRQHYGRTIIVSQTLKLVDKIPCGYCLCETSLAKLCKMLFISEDLQKESLILL